MGKRFVAAIAILIFLGGMLAGCQNNKPVQSDSNELQATETELSQNGGQEEEALEPLQSEKLRASYRLGESGDRVIEYDIITLSNGQKALAGADGNCILSGFAEFDLMLNLIIAKKDGLWGFYDQTGTKIIEHQYEEISNYEMPDDYKANGLVGVKKGGLWGAIDQEGEIVIQPEFEYIELNYYEEVEPFVKVKQDGKFGYVTYEGQPLVDTVWDTAFMDVLNVPEDIIFVKQGDRWGGIRVEASTAAPVDWDLLPSEEAQLAFNNWKYDYQWDFYKQQIRDGQTDFSTTTKIFFNDYFRRNSMELRCLPEFALGQSPQWDDLTYFFVFNTPHQWNNGSVSKEQFAETVTKYFGAISYSHQSSVCLEYHDGSYTAAGMSNHGFYIYELTGLAKGVTADGQDSWRARITGYYFNELDGDPTDTFSSDNARAVYQEMKKAEYNGFNFWQACDRLVWNNPGSILEPASEWTIEFTVNDPLGDLYFTYLSCERKDYQPYTSSCDQVNPGKEGWQCD